MKKLIVSACFATFTISIFAQGTVVFGNHILNSLVAPIYGPNPGNITEYLTGNSPTGYPPGTTIYGGAPLGTLPGDYIGTFTAELWGGATLDSMAPVPGADAPLLTKGFFATATSPVTIPGVPQGSTAFLQLRMWDNEAGTITSFAAAVAANGGFSASAVFQSLPLGGGLVPPPNMVGLTSFNLNYTPEPTTLALVGLGAALMCFFRRRSTATPGAKPREIWHR
jgi:hypothetical protein